MFFDELSNDEWAHLSALVSDEPAVRLNRRGRPRAEPRIVANAVLWILTTGEPWSRLPGRYPSGPTCRRRFEEWQQNGTLIEMVRLLSQGGRTFAYVPEPGAPVPTPKPVVDTPPQTPAPRDDGMRGVFWKSPESWQTPSSLEHRAHVWRSLDPITDITRQLSGDSEDDSAVQIDAPHDEAADDAQAEDAHRPVWMNMSARGTQIADRRGYMIYVAVEKVPGAMFRAWAEIMKDGRRVERSGLIGPRFAQADAAQAFALEWAHDWIDRHCRTLAATPEEVAAAQAALDGAIPEATDIAPSNDDQPLTPAAQAPRTLPALRTVPDVVNHHANAHVAAYANARRIALRRYPSNEPGVAPEDVADNTASDRFPKSSELFSHAG